MTKQDMKQVKAEVDKLAKSVGYKDEQFQYLPVSAFIGDNIKEKGKITWWTGPTLSESN